MQFTRHNSNHGRRRASGSAELTPVPGFPRSAEKSSGFAREQLNRAARVQRGLLPDVSVPVAGFKLSSAYHPCQVLGGDFYDICRHGNCATLMVADAMGHGAEAALVTMLLKAVFQELAPQIGNTDELLTNMNERLLGLIPEGSFAATTVARFDAGSSEVQISNAGMPYPFVLRASNKSVHKVRLTGRPLGLNINGTYQEYDVFRVALAPGDILLISSDGLGSVERDNGQCFEDHLSLALTHLVGLAGEEVIQSLLAEALEFSGGRPFPDDINLIAVSRDQLGEGH
jgi:serine phosphatase RsbU (regulator of sigma subunit)